MAAAFEFVRVKSLSAATTGASSTDAVIEVCALHNLRQGHCHSRDEQSGPIDPARSSLNVIMRGCDTAAAVAQMARDLVRVGGWEKQYQRANAAVGAELVFSLPASAQLDVISYFRACIEWAEQFFDAPALSAIAHLDQRHPHVHLIFLGVRGGQWRGGRFFGDRDAINAMHAHFHVAVGQPHGLRRQQQSSESTAVRHATAMREIDAIVSYQGLLNDPLVRQALVSLIAAAPERLRAAREKAMAAGELAIALPGGDVPGDEKPKCYPVIALSPGDASIEAQNAIGDGQKAMLVQHSDRAEQTMPPADQAPQPITPVPIHVDTRAGSLPVKGSDDLPERLTRVRDADLPADRWDANQGEHVPLPPPQPSAREQAMRDVRQLLGMRQRRQEDRLRQVPAMLDANRSRADQDDHQLDAVPETMLDAA